MSIYDAINGIFSQNEKFLLHNIRTLFIVNMWLITTEQCCCFTVGSQRFGLVNVYSQTNFLQHIENVAL